MASTNPVIIKTANFNPAFQSETGVELQAKTNNNDDITHKNKGYPTVETSKEHTKEQKEHDKSTISPVESTYKNEKINEAASVVIDTTGESDFEDDDGHDYDHCCARNTDKITTGLSNCCKRHKTVLKFVLAVLLLCGYIAYLICAIIYSFNKAIPLIVLTVLVVIILTIYGISYKFGEDINKHCCVPLNISWLKNWKYIRWVLYLGLLAAFIIFVVIDVRKDPYRLTSLSGIAILLLITFIFSKNPARVKWRPVIWGLVLQMLLGIIVLRWSVGLTAVTWFSEQVVSFLSYTDAGSRFVFGDDFTMHPFAFQSLPVVIFFSAVIGILYYWGVMQKVITTMAVVLQITMGTTALETLATASNIFVSYVEVAPILVPYIHRLTKSELHAILTSGFATVAGSILAIYISFGAPAVHLISACIISAPAALAVAKLSFPETKVSKTKTQRDVHLPKASQKNFVEAAAAGAMIAVKLIAGIVACLIAFLSIVAFIDAVLAWLGTRVGILDPQLSFALICSYVFWPLTVMMGVEPADAKRVASMLGLKIFVDDVLCYADLGDAVRNGDITERSAVIATYACCGFGSLGALGVALGTMFAIAPKRKKAISDIIIRALINGNIAAFMTACVAGFLYPGMSNATAPLQMAVNATDLTTAPTI